MLEEVTFVPGDTPSPASYSSDVLVNIDGRLLVEDNTGYIVDTSGNRIIIGGGFPNGDAIGSGTWQPGDNV